MKALAALIAAVVLATSPGALQARSPVVVELFTAQGCASCNTANAMVAKLVDRPGVAVLTWPVDYWDYLGWKDTFAQPAFTARQKAFGRRLGPRDVYTPQIVVNGASQLSGDDADGVTNLLSNAAPADKRAPKIRIGADGRIRVTAGRRPVGKAEVWLVRYNPKEQDVGVTAGDNRGATVVVRNVVRQCVRLGPWSGHAVSYPAPPAAEPGLGEVVLVQGVRGGPVIAVARAKPPPS